MYFSFAVQEATYFAFVHESSHRHYVNALARLCTWVMQIRHGWIWSSGHSSPTMLHSFNKCLFIKQVLCTRHCVIYFNMEVNKTWSLWPSVSQSKLWSLPYVLLKKSSVNYFSLYVVDIFLVDITWRIGFFFQCALRT